jgi:hypothetical protein
MTMADWAKGIIDIGDSSPSANILLYGAPSCGKTALLSALPDALLLGFDPGYVTARSMKRKCKVRPINTERELLAGMDWLEDGGYQNYRWIIADGLNILQTKLTLDSAKDAWIADNSKRANAFQPDKPDYYRQQNGLKVLVARLCDMPVNVAFTSHALIGDSDDNAEWIRPHIEGREYKVGNFVTGMMSSIGYMAVREKMRVVKRGGKPIEEPTGEVSRHILWEQRYNSDTGVTIMAKDQLNVFPAVMRDATGEQMHELVMSAGA